MNRLKKYILLWISQSVSQLGSAMTGFSLILWTYEKSHSAMSVSLMSFCNYVPYILVSLFAGAFVDKHNKKSIMLVSDSIAALGTLFVLIRLSTGSLLVWHIYVVNIVIGFMNAFQEPAAAVAIGRIVPEDMLTNVSGMNSFSANLVSLLSPVLAAFLFSFGGLDIILLADLLSFLFAFLVLLILIPIPDESPESKELSWIGNTLAGFRFLKNERGLLLLMLTMALINFFSRLTYENILSPMILARSGNNGTALGIVNASIGVGGIIGGILVSSGKGMKNQVRMIYFSAAISFLLGDITMALGRNALAWSFAGVAASLPIPFILACQNVILYRKVPEHMQGRVFAVRNAVQYGTIPIGILLGGFLADYIFEPLMQTELFPVKVLSILVGRGPGSGMAVMFLGTGLLGFLISFISCWNKDIRKLID